MDSHKSAIDVFGIRQRPGKDIKSLGSILQNIKNPRKYKGYKNLFEIKDIAAITVICHFAVVCIKEKDKI
ncbi:hypothetical protein HOB10_03810 [Candidatus Parcubacteria bacterium]|jgi:hypothetical protein|nr:hypothetical protein [Candidatus Parcubacteria bacterium]